MPLLRRPGKGRKKREVPEKMTPKLRPQQQKVGVTVEVVAAAAEGRWDGRSCGCSSRR